MSLDDPNKKMSKSIPGGCLYLSDKPEVIKEKVKRAVTDSMSTIDYDPDKRPAVSNLVLVYSEISGLTTTEVVKKFEGVGYAKFKEDLAEVIISKLKPFQERRNKLLKNKKLVMKILSDGAKKAQVIARKTMTEVNKKAGLI